MCSELLDCNSCIGLQIFFEQYHQPDGTLSFADVVIVSGFQFYYKKLEWWAWLLGAAANANLHNYLYT